MPGVQRLDVRVTHRRGICQASIDPGFDRGKIAIEHPQQHAEGIEVLAAATLGLAEAELPHGLVVEVADIGRDYLEVVEGSVLARIRGIAGFRQVAGGKRIAVEDDEGAPIEQRQADLERRRVERYQDLRGVTGGRNRTAAEVYLVGRDTECRSRGGPDFGRVVRKGREIGARQRRGDRELRSHQLDAVARVAREADDNGVYLFVFTHEI